MRKQVWSFLSVAVMTAGGMLVYGADGDDFELPPILDVDEVVLEDLELEAAPVEEAAPITEAAPEPAAQALEEVSPVMELPALEDIQEPAEVSAPEESIEIAQAPEEEAVPLPQDVADAPIALPANEGPIAPPEMDAPITELAPAPVEEVPGLDIPTVDELVPAEVPTRLPEVTEPVEVAEPVEVLQPAAPVEIAKTPEVVTPAEAPQVQSVNPLDTTAVVVAGARANRVRAAKAVPCKECNKNGQLLHRCPRPDSGYIPQYPRRNPPRMHGPMMDPYYTLRGPRDFEDPNPRPIGP